MPILDPSVQLALCTNEAEIIESNNFFLYYLKLASENISRSFESIESYFQFENDLKASEELLKSLFKFNYSFKMDFNNPAIQNFYEYLYYIFNEEDRLHVSEIQSGQYYVYMNDKQIGDKFISSNYFRPVISKSTFHSWYFTDSPTAILCVNLLASTKIHQEMLISKLEIDLINLEIGLMTAAGYTLVVSFITDSNAINESLKSKNKIIINDKEVTIQEYFILKTILTHNFSEIHLNLASNERDKTKSKHKHKEKEKDSLFNLYDKIFTILFKKYDKFKGHFYIYSPYFKGTTAKSEAYLKILKKMPLFHIFNFSDDIRSALNFGQLIGSSNSEFKCRPFPYFKNGFDKKMIQIMLCNVPVYSNQDNNFNTMPSEHSYMSWAYINREDFLSWSGIRVPITLDDSSNTHQFLDRFINSDDIHVVKPQFFVNDTLYLTRTDRETLDTVNKIQEKSKNKTLGNDNKNIEQEGFHFHITNEKKIKNKLIYVIYAFQLISDNTFLYKSQIFTAFEACKTCFNNEKDNKDKGFIYQVETGEGKSFIIQVISAVICLMKTKKKVHIASSNIPLAIRDYIGSYEFFNKLGLKAAVLLHQNELPFHGLNDAEKEEMMKHFPDDFFNDSLFDNSSNMNYSICDFGTDDKKSKKADIIISTFVNFESFYLRMMETSTARVNDYFQNCYLLIDEADSILIDELSNGTILSRSMKTNCKKILKYIYKRCLECNFDKTKADIVFNEVKQKWPKCRDMKLHDIQDMFDEIKLVNQEEFINGKKYSIETEEIEIKKPSILPKIKSAHDIGVKKIQSVKNKFFNLFKRKSSKTDANNAENQDSNDNIKLDNKYHTDGELMKDDTQDEEEEEEEEEVEENKKHKKGKKYKYKKYIVPFDFDHKGVLEPNKEFSGFVQQFIAIKEIINNKKEMRDLVIKDVSMNYLYVSHPIFVKLYKGVCGFTGTIGNKYDKDILKNRYKLVTRKIPRNKPNRRIELPTILCSDFEERNRKIVNEVLEFHEKEFPVLVIFQDLNEISDVFEMLIARGVDYVNIFDGKKSKVKPDLIAGRKGAISLGTNVCGRGTDIKSPEKPLHVIVSYFTANSRIMQQAFGRTSRQGREGTVSIICLKSQFISPIEMMETKSMEQVLQDFRVKNEMQKNFIDEFRKYREWIFDSKIGKQTIDPKYVKQMGQTNVNVNRIKAYNFEFPICMSVQTFLMIQGQKIFSLFNCPNCKYTWQLFQQYIREMILETWSLFIDRADKKYKREPPNCSYEEFLKSERKLIDPWLNIFFPTPETQTAENEHFKNITSVVETFMNIFEVVSRYGQNKIESSYPKRLLNLLENSKKGDKTYFAYNFGFKPYSLVDKSGARISVMNGVDPKKKRNFISDPELLYSLRGRPKAVISITRKIDGIFESICSKINNIIGSYTGLKLFLRRTLSGCEFGLCIDFCLQNISKKATGDPNCIIDLDPLFIFSILLKSEIPLLAGILIIGLIYIAKIAEKISEYIAAFPAKITGEFVKRTMKEAVKLVANHVLKTQIEIFCDKIINFLTEVLRKQIITLSKFKPEMENIFAFMMNILTVKNFNLIGSLVQDIFTEKVCNVKMNPGFGQDFLSDGLPFAHFFKIGLLLLLCLASFMMNFHCKKDAIKYDEKKVAGEYNNNQETEKCQNENEKYVEKEEFMQVNIEKYQLEKE